MSATNTPWDPQRAYYRDRIHSLIESHLDAHPGHARALAIGMCTRVCSVMLVQDLETWALSLTLKLECPFLAQSLDRTDAEPDDTS